MRAWLCCVLLGGCHWAFGISEVPPDAFVAPGRWASVVAGANHVCAIDVEQRAFCWGDDRHGQIGTGTAPTTPQQIGSATWLALAAGPLHTCGLQSDGKAWCWGYNPDGQTTGANGADTTMPKLVPMPVAAPVFEEITAGLRHTCARGGGTIYCWGDPMATGAGASTPLPALVKGPGSWTHVSAGYDHTCAIDGSGGLWCWGHDDAGQLGGPGTIALMPMQVPIPTGAVALQVSAGTFRTCAVIAASAGSTTGQIWCWGTDGGVIGTASPTTPSQVIAGDDWSAVATGNDLACGLRGGMATCWGAAHHGGLGDGLWDELVMPTSAARSFAADAIAIGIGQQLEENVCALTQRDLACWGDNRGGQLGAPATLHLAGAVVPQPTAPWSDVWVGQSHTCGRDLSGGVWCWGADDSGQVTAHAGFGVAAPCASASCDQPTPVPAPVAVTGEMIAGADFTCGHSGADLDCWGSNAGGALLDPDANVHASHTALDAGRMLIGGGPALCSYNPGLSCWGTINGERQASAVAITDNLFTGTYAVAFGERSSCAIVAGNARVCWGYNYWAEFGNNMIGPGSGPLMPPTRVTDPTMYNKLAMTSRHGCATSTTGDLACWGSDYNGETGQAVPDPATGTTLKPASVAGLTQCSAVTATFDVSCAICGGTPRCWGRLLAGRLGRDVESNAADAHAVAVVLPASRTWTQLGSGAEHSCALADDGTLACWGLGVRGQLGDGGHGSTVPVAIPTPP